MDVSFHKSKPKVVQLSSVHHAFDTRIFHKISKSLVKAGYDVDLIIQHNQDEVVDGVHIKALPVALKKSDRPLKIIPRLFLRVIEYPANTIFHFHDPELMPVGILLKWFGYKVIYDIHEDVPGDILDKDWIPKPIRTFIAGSVKLLENLSSYYFDNVITVTEHIQKQIKGDVVLIQNFPLLKEIREKETTNNDQDEIFYVGNISRIRGILEMLKAVELLNRNKKVNFLIGGDFANLQIEKEAKQETGWEYVEYYPWLSREDIAIKAHTAKAGLVIFHQTKNHINAQPNKLFEYMMHGLPIIASDFPLWKRVIGGNRCGVLVDPNSPKEIAEAVDWLLENPQEAEKMGINGRNAVLEKYNWANEEKKLLKLYAELENKNN